MNRRTIHRWSRCVMAALWVALIHGRVLAAEGELGADGARWYRSYCSSCHGPSGRGDGPDAEMFVPRPRDLREGFLKKYKDADLVQRLRDGRPLELALDLPSLRTRAQDVEDIVAHLKRLPALEWKVLEPGWELYVDRCELCHGPFGKPARRLPAGVKRPRALGDRVFQRSLSDDELAVVVRHGRSGMPALTPRVSEADARQLAAFVRLLSPGFEQYSRSCAVCHGDDGRGVSYPGEVFPAPAVVFDRDYFSRRDSDQLRQGVWHMVGQAKPVMPHFRWILMEEKARAIVQWLKKGE
jgi:mono/diheme cytochrome c family protein